MASGRGFGEVGMCGIDGRYCDCGTSDQFESWTLYYSIFDIYFGISFLKHLIWKLGLGFGAFHSHFVGY